MVEVGRVGPILEWYRLYRCIAQQSNTHLKLQYSWLSHGDGSIVQGCIYPRCFENVAHNSLETVGPSGMQLRRFFAVCSKIMQNLNTSTTKRIHDLWQAMMTPHPHTDLESGEYQHSECPRTNTFSCVISRLFWNCHCHTQKSMVTTTQL